MKVLAVCLSLLPACRVAASADAVYFANPVGEDFPVPSRKLAGAAATSPGHVKDRYIVKLCETSWLDREPAETAAALAESVGAKMHVYKHALGGFSVTDCSAEAAEALKNKPEVCSVLPWRRRSHSMTESGSGQEPIEAINFWGKNRENDTKVAILMADSRSIRDHTARRRFIGGGRAS